MKRNDRSTALTYRPGRWFALALSVVPILVTACCGFPGLAGAAEAHCPNEQLREEQPFAAGLPDCRAYEMVSPLEKDDASISFVDARASTEGAAPAITYYSAGSFAEPKSALLESRYLAGRTGSGWSTLNISPPYVDYKTNALTPPFDELLFAPDLSKGVLESRYTPLVEGQQAGLVNLYVADTATGAYQPITTVVPEGTEPFRTATTDARPQVEGASTGLDYVVFQQNASLCCGATPEQEHIYEWSNGRLSLVDVPPPGVPLEYTQEVGAPAAKGEPALYGDIWHAVSSDGARVFFTGQERENVEFLGQLFMRENPMQPQSPYVSGRCAVPEDACTVEVSASQRTTPDPQGPQPAFFRDASTDGAHVFFTSRAELTNDARTGPADNAANLYEYDAVTGVLSDLTVDPGEEDGAAVLGVVSAADDGSYIYFVANGALAADASPGNCRVQESEEAIAGERACNLYVEHRGEGGWEPPKFIATLAGSNASTFALESPGDGDEADWVGYEDATVDRDFGPGRHTARVTPDGTAMAFESELQLTEYSNVPEEPFECENDRCREVYLYNALTDKLVCASCDPSGHAPVGPAELGGHEEEFGAIAATPSPFYLPRNLSEDGGRLFFQSPDPLVTRASDGRLNVYEWERAGLGSCTTASAPFSTVAGGCLLAISNTAGGSESHFMDANPNGSDAFIATADQLLPASDADTRVDVYDARVDGGFPVLSRPQACGSADACKPPVSSQPTLFAAPVSATFAGPGNLAPPPAPAIPPGKKKIKKKKPPKKPSRCRRGHIRRHRRCDPRASKHRRGPAHGARQPQQNRRVGR